MAAFTIIVEDTQDNKGVVTQVKTHQFTYLGESEMPVYRTQAQLIFKVMMDAVNEHLGIDLMSDETELSREEVEKHIASKNEKL